MNWDAISAIGEIVAALAVIFSLVYVGKGLSQNNANQRLAALQAHNEAMRDNIALLANHADTWARGLEHYPNLSAEENIRFALLLHASLRHMEHAFSLNKSGVLSEEDYTKSLEMICSLLMYPSSLQWWEGRKAYFTDAFRISVDALIASKRLSQLYTNEFGGP